MTSVPLLVTHIETEALARRICLTFLFFLNLSSLRMKTYEEDIGIIARILKCRGKRDIIRGDKLLRAR